MSETAAGAPPATGTITVDTPVGHELTGVKKRAAIQLMGTRVWGRFNPNHWDPEYASATGLDAPIQTGEMCSAYIAEMCVNHFGARFFTGARFACKYVNATRAGETITTYGRVTDRVPADGGVRFTVEVWASDDDGEVKAAGTVEVTVDG